MTVVNATLGLMTVKELREELKKRGLPTSGRKVELVARLTETAGDAADTTVLADQMEGLSVPYEVEAEARDMAVTIVGEADAIVIATEAEYRFAGEFLTTRVKPALRALDDAFDPIIRSWHSGHKQTIAVKKKLAAPILDAEGRVKSAMVEFHESFVAKQKEEQKQLQAAMKAKAEEAIVNEAAELLEQGKIEEAEELLRTLDDGTAEAVVPLTARKPQSGAGISTRTMKRFRIVDESKIDRAFLHPDMRLIQMTVNEMGKAAEEVVGGIEYYEEQAIAARAR